MSRQLWAALALVCCLLLLTLQAKAQEVDVTEGQNEVDFSEDGDSRASRADEEVVEETADSSEVVEVAEDASTEEQEVAPSEELVSSEETTSSEEVTSSEEMTSSEVTSSEETSTGEIAQQEAVDEAPQQEIVEETSQTETVEEVPATEAPAAATASPAAADDGLGSCGRVPVFEEAYGRSINRSDNELKKRAEEGEKRILYGLDSTPGEWPWVVKLKMISGDRHSSQACTGTLLNERWIITAAHCLNDAATAEATIGLYDLIVPDAESVTRTCDKLIKHPGATQTHNDLALLRMSEPVQFNKHIGPICQIPKSSGDLDSLRLGHKFCYTLGYGLNEDMGRPVKLQKLEIKTASCEKLEKDVDHKLPDVACILPRSADQGGTCRGDSGGPDLCYDEKTNRWYIFGVISFGPSDCNRDSSDPSDWLTASVDLTNYQDWISETIAAESG